MPDDVVVDRERFHAAQRRQQAQASAERLELTSGQEGLLARLDPPLYADDLTHQQVCEYLGITRNTLYGLIRIHSDELATAGYVVPEVFAQARYSRRAVMHIALLLRPSTSDSSTRIKKALGVYTPAAQQSRSHRWATHVSSCKAIVAQAGQLAEDVQELDPEVVWAQVSGMNRWQLQVMVVALGAMVPLDSEGMMRFLGEVGAKVPVADRTGRGDVGRRGQNVARGLASLIPVTRSEYEEHEL